MQNEPKYYNYDRTLGNGVRLSFKGENWGTGLQDTEVKIEDKQLCWIDWKDKDAFIDEIREVIDKYRI